MRCTMLENQQGKHGELLRMVALVAMMLQNTTLAIAMRYSRMAKAPDETLYLVSTAVVTSETLKLVSSAALAVGALTPSEIVAELVSVDALMMVVPAVLYTVQNTLQYVAFSHLDVSVCQVLIQMKLVTTALFSVAMLGRRMTPRQWLGIFVCALGVAMVEMSTHNHTARSAANDLVEDEARDRFVGIVAVTVVCLTSGFASVYTEKIFKAGKTNMWVRNMQLALFSVAVGMGAVLVRDGETVAEKGFFVGYNPAVWFVIAVQALGGLVVAVVVKYADSVAKGLGTGISIVFTSLLSMALFGFQANHTYVAGASCVLLAIYLYSCAGAPTAPAAAAEPVPITAMAVTADCGGGKVVPEEALRRLGMETSSLGKPVELAAMATTAAAAAAAAVAGEWLQKAGFVGPDQRELKVHEELELLQVSCAS